jgi:hypothetical protein
MTLIILSAVDFGRFGNSDIAVTNAAQAGAAYGAANPPGSNASVIADWQNTVSQVVKAEMATLGTPTSVVVSAPYTDSGRTLVKVTVQYPFTTYFTWPGIPSSITIQKVAVMRVLQ